MSLVSLLKVTFTAQLHGAGAVHSSLDDGSTLSWSLPDVSNMTQALEGLVQTASSSLKLLRHEDAQSTGSSADQKQKEGTESQRRDLDDPAASATLDDDLKAGAADIMKDLAKSAPNDVDKASVDPTADMTKKAHTEVKSDDVKADQAKSGDFKNVGQVADTKVAQDAKPKVGQASNAAKVAQDAKPQVGHAGDADKVPKISDPGKKNAKTRKMQATGDSRAAKAKSSETLGTHRRTDASVQEMSKLLVDSNDHLTPNPVFAAGDSKPLVRTAASSVTASKPMSSGGGAASETTIRGSSASNAIESRLEALERGMTQANERAVVAEKRDADDEQEIAELKHALAGATAALAHDTDYEKAPKGWIPKGKVIPRVVPHPHYAQGSASQTDDTRTASPTIVISDELSGGHSPTGNKPASKPAPPAQGNQEYEPNGMGTKVGRTSGMVHNDNGSWGIGKTQFGSPNDWGSWVWIKSPDGDYQLIWLKANNFHKWMWMFPGRYVWSGPHRRRGTWFKITPDDWAEGNHDLSRHMWEQGPAPHPYKRGDIDGNWNDGMTIPGMGSKFAMPTAAPRGWVHTTPKPGSGYVNQGRAEHDAKLAKDGQLPTEAPTLSPAYAAQAASSWGSR